MSLLKSIKQQLGLGPAAENHFWDGSVANILKLKKGTPDAPGVDVLTVAADGKVAFPQNAQTWQNVAVSRLIGTEYTNNTGLPIDISVSANHSVAGNLLSIYINDVQVINSISQPAANNRLAVYGRIPNGATYKLYTSSGTNTAVTWWELR